MRVKVKVTDIDITLGTNFATSCPIARALKRQLPKASRVCVLHRFALVDHCRLALSRAAREFVDRFDHGKPVEPATFILTDFGREYTSPARGGGAN